MNMNAAFSTVLVAIVGVMLQLSGLPSSDAFSPGDGICSGGSTGASALISMIHRLDTKIQQETLQARTTILSFDTLLTNAFLALVANATGLKQAVDDLDVGFIRDMRASSSSCMLAFPVILTQITYASSSVAKLHSLLTIMQDVKTEVSSIVQWVTLTSDKVANTTVNTTAVKSRVDTMQVRLQALIQLLVQLTADDVNVNNSLVGITSKMVTLHTSLMTTSSLLSTHITNLISTQTLLTGAMTKANIAVTNHAQSLATLASSIQSFSSNMTTSFSSFTNSFNNTVSQLATSSSSASTSISSVSVLANQAQSAATSVGQTLTTCGTKLTALTSSISTLSMKATSMSSSMTGLQSGLDTTSQTATSASSSISQLTSTQSAGFSSAITELTQLNSKLGVVNSQMSTSFSGLASRVSTCNGSVASLSVEVSANTALLQKLSQCVTETKVNLAALLDALNAIIGTAKCAIACNNTGPQVCGSDGVTYTNNCHLRKAACFAADNNVIISQTHTGTCVNPCNNQNGGCTQLCRSVGNVVTCGCIPGYYLNADNTSCTASVNGGWTVWSVWSCSVTCGSGIATRARTCTNPAPKGTGANCVGAVTETRACVLAGCPVNVNGGWSAWSVWGCSVTCGSGIASRSRTCTNPAPRGTGASCVGAGTETKACNPGVCPVNGGWSAWSVWSCSVTCGSGIASQYRTCTNPPPRGTGAGCVGASTETKTCNPVVCPVNGGWSAWSVWSCSVTCGKGIETRARNCTNPAPQGAGANCVGAGTENKACTLTACPGVCPANFDLIKGRCYYIKLPTRPMAVAEATTACISLGAKLVSFETLTEFHALQSKVKTLLQGVQYGKNFWTSALEVGPNPRVTAWIWASTRGPINVNVWKTVGPHSHNTCGAMYGYHGYKLSDVSCTRSNLQEYYGYICERA